RAIRLVEYTQVLLQPQVAHRGFTANSDLIETGCHLFRGSLTIEKTHDLTAVRHRLHPDFKRAFLRNAKSLLAQWILVYGNHLAVRQNGNRVRSHPGEIISRDERRGEYRPETEVSAVFVFGHATIADFQHVGIIPVSRAGKPLEPVLAEANLRHDRIAIADVTGRAPKISANRRT